MPNDRNGFIRQFIGILVKIEDLVLIGLLILMMVVAVLQIILRNLFDSGLVFGDELTRVLVLWISLAGAMVASRDNRHISIDLISRYLSGPLKRFSGVLVSTFTALVCGIMAFFSLKFVRMEQADGLLAFSGIPVWICETIIPVAFTVICLRYILLSCSLLLNASSGPNNP